MTTQRMDCCVATCLAPNADCAEILQNVVDQGLRDQKWYEAVDGTYMRLDIPLIMPHLLKQLEERKQGERSLLMAALLIL